MSEPESIPATDTPLPVVESAPCPSSGRILTFALIGGLLAGGLAWLGGEAIRDMFKPAYVTPKSPFSNENDLLKLAALSKETGVAFVILGGVLGGALGAAGGLARRSTRAALTASVVGLLLGIAASLGAVTLLMPVADGDRARMIDDLTFPILVLSGFWVPAGLTAGLAFGLGVGQGARGPILRGAVGGLIGAALGTVLYVIIGGLSLPSSQTGSPLPMSITARAIARTVVALATAAVVGSMVGGVTTRKRPATN